jgi:hypothetical protein
MTPSYRDETISLIDDLCLESKKIEYDTVGFEHINNDYFCGFETASFEERRKVFEDEMY